LKLNSFSYLTRKIIAELAILVIKMYKETNKQEHSFTILMKKKMLQTGYNFA
jgi:hypothetical protein